MGICISAIVVTNLTSEFIMRFISLGVLSKGFAVGMELFNSALNEGQFAFPKSNLGIGVLRLREPCNENERGK